jgi:hypothetical protein
MVEIGWTVSLDGWAQYDEKFGRWLITRQPRHNIEGHNLLIRISAIIASKNYNSILLERWHFGDTIEPTKFYVSRETNSHLKGPVSPQVLFPQDKTDTPHEIYLFPDSLLAALWTSFLMELMGKIRIRQCAFCGKWGEVIKTRRSFYCSNH